MIDEFRNGVFSPESQDTKAVKKISSSIKKGAKRTRETGGENDDKKKIRKTQLMEAADYFDEDKVKKLTVADLKAYLKVCKEKIIISLSNYDNSVIKYNINNVFETIH